MSTYEWPFFFCNRHIFSKEFPRTPKNAYFSYPQKQIFLKENCQIFTWISIDKLAVKVKSTSHIKTKFFSTMPRWLNGFGCLFQWESVQSNCLCFLKGFGCKFCQKNFVYLFNTFWVQIQGNFFKEILFLSIYLGRECLDHKKKRPMVSLIDFDSKFWIFECNPCWFHCKFVHEVVSLSIWQIWKNFQPLFFFKKIFERQIFKE